MPDVLCAWCGTTIGQSPVVDSHGICRACSCVLLGVPALSLAELEELPFGAIILSEDGTVLAYNHAEEELSGRRARDVVGRNFFTQVAPCTSVQAFQGEFQDFCRGAEPSRTFQFLFPFASGSIQVQIAFLRKGAGGVVAIHKLPRA